VLSAGRTDSGVHALGQVANFRTGSAIPAANFRPGLQNFLPDDVIVREAVEVPLDFHATYSARWKRYRYVIHNSRVADPFVRRYAYRYGGELDVPRMHAAAQALVGTHDFRCFETEFPNRATSVRTVTELTLARCAGWPVWRPGVWHDTPCRESATRSVAPHCDGDGEFIRLDIVADGFLYNMVRAITGTLLNVGRGRWQVEDVARILAGGDRTQAGETAPACGLYLVEVGYDHD
jgi:tRNA pseudouridine38-40 synthase